MYLTYDYYSNKYGGTSVSSSDFPKYELRARMLLDGFTLKPKTTKKLLETEYGDYIRLTVCELIDNTKEEELLLEKAKTGLELQLKGIASETVKDHSISVNTKGNVYDDVKSYIQNKDMQTLSKYLLPTGLLYRGVGHDL